MKGTHNKDICDYCKCIIGKRVFSVEGINGKKKYCSIACMSNTRFVSGDIVGRFNRKEIFDISTSTSNLSETGVQ
jgi:hypothetical protein